MVVYQDNPGKGFQASIFKRFFWWEDECARLIGQKLGIAIEKRSYRSLGVEASKVSDLEADEAIRRQQITTEGVSVNALRSAVKLTIALRRELEKDDRIKCLGINCLNESQFSDTTPCLAWSQLYEEKGVIWGCEADTMSALTGYILNRSMDVPFAMTNLYPFLMGSAALKHERISAFPVVKEPENHILAAHCGYLGVVPACFSSSWTLRPRVLAIVDENATAIDARFPVGDITLAKLGPGLNRISVVEGDLEDYVQNPGSDCLNGALLKVRDGRKLISNLWSHHYILMTGHNLAGIETICRVFDLELCEP